MVAIAKPLSSRRAGPPAAVRDGLAVYISEIAHTPLLTAREEQDLSRRVRLGDEAARQRMILANLRFVVNIAKAYQFMGVPLTDLIAEGNIGLIKAVERFDASGGHRFATYASHWIKQSIKRGLTYQARSIRLPMQVVEKLAAIRRVAAKLAAASGREPTDDEIAAELGLSPRKIAALREAACLTVSLDSPVGNDGQQPLATMVADPRATDAASEAEDHDRLEQLRQALGWLSERDRHIIIHRFGLDGGECHSYEELGQDHNLSRERIRQIITRALQRLRRALEHQERPHYDSREIRGHKLRTPHEA
jgi:RNA polymerase primary sigma factor